MAEGSTIPVEHVVAMATSWASSGSGSGPPPSLPVSNGEIRDDDLHQPAGQVVAGPDDSQAPRLRRRGQHGLHPAQGVPPPARHGPAGCSPPGHRGAAPFLYRRGDGLRDVGHQPGGVEESLPGPPAGRGATALVDEDQQEGHGQLLDGRSRPDDGAVQHRPRRADDEEVAQPLVEDDLRRDARV